MYVTLNLVSFLLYGCSKLPKSQHCHLPWVKIENRVKNWILWSQCNTSTAVEKQKVGFHMVKNLLFSSRSVLRNMLMHSYDSNLFNTITEPCSVEAPWASWWWGQQRKKKETQKGGYKEVWVYGHKMWDVLSQVKSGKSMDFWFNSKATLKTVFHLVSHFNQQCSLCQRFRHAGRSAWWMGSNLMYTVVRDVRHILSDWNYCPIQFFKSYAMLHHMEIFLHHVKYKSRPNTPMLRSTVFKALLACLHTVTVHMCSFP